MDGRIVYVVDVLAADAGSAAGCGAPGRQVQFRIADTAMATAGSWRDDGVTLLDLSVDGQATSLYLPGIMQHAQPISPVLTLPVKVVEQLYLPAIQR